MKTAPTRKKVMITAFGVRMGRQAGRFCCLKRESAAQARREAGRKGSDRGGTQTQLQEALCGSARAERRAGGAPVLGGGAAALTRRPLALGLLHGHAK